MGVVSGQAKWKEYDLYKELKRSNPDIVIYETFEFRNQPKKKLDRVELFSRNLIGVLNLYVQERQTCALYTQTPFQGKSYYTDTKLKVDKLHKPLKGGHANDAVRHLLQWYTFGPGYKHNTNGYKPLA